MSSPDTRFTQRARELYREAAQHVDPAISARLRAARARALATPRDGAHPLGARWLIPGGAFAAVALAAVMLWQPLARTTLTPTSATINSTTVSSDVDADLPPDADRTDPKLYQNLDFYGWLAANDRSTRNH